MSAVGGRRRETSRHRSDPWYVPSERVVRVTGALAPVLSLLPALAGTVVVQSLSPAGQRLPTGSARVDLAAAWLATEPGALVGAHGWVGAPPGGVLQLGLLLRLLQAGHTQSVLAAAHGAMLLLAAVQVALVWLVLRGLRASSLAAGLGAAVFGIAPVAVAAHSETSAGAIGACWLLLAVLLALRSTRVASGIGSGVTAAIAVASAPVLILPVLVAAVAAIVADRAARRRRTTARTDRRLLASALAFVATALVLGVGSVLLAAAPATAAAQRLDAVAAAAVPPSVGAASFARWLLTDPLSLVLAVAAVALMAPSARGRPVAIAAVLLAAAVVWPLGADGVLPLVLLLPAVAIAVGLSVDAAVAALGHPMFVRSALGSGWLTGVAAVLVVALAVWLAGLAALVPGPLQPVARVERWVASSVPSGQVVLVGLAAWPDVERSSRATVGWYAGRPGAAGVPSSVPWARSDYVVTDASLVGPRGTAVDAVLGRSLPVARFGAGSAEMQVRAVRPASSPAPTTPPVTAADRRAQAARKLAGQQLAENPRIEVTGAGRTQLLSGEVDVRLAIVLAQFVTRHRVTVAGFGVAAGDTSGVRTTVLISAVDGQAVPADATATGDLLRFLSALRGDFAARSIDATDDGVTAAFAPDPTFVPGG